MKQKIILIGMLLCPILIMLLIVYIPTGIFAAIITYTLVIVMVLLLHEFDKYYKKENGTK